MELAVARARTRQLGVVWPRQSMKASEILFTSGATEAIHRAICGMVGPGDEVVVSGRAPAVLAHAANRGDTVCVPVDEAGRIEVARC